MRTADSFRVTDDFQCYHADKAPRRDNPPRSTRQPSAITTPDAHVARPAFRDHAVSHDHRAAAAPPGRPQQRRPDVAVAPKINDNASQA